MKVRNCNAGYLNTGTSECQLDFAKVIMALVVNKGQKLPKNLTGTRLEELCHAARPARVMPIARFVEYAKNGGEANVAATGYGPNQVTDFSARTDTYTMMKYSELLAAQLSKTVNTEYDVYYIDEKFFIYGVEDGTDEMGGFPMSTIYPGATPHPTSSAKAELTVNFAFTDARAALEHFAYEQLDFNPLNFAKGLVPVKFVECGEGTWKLVEAVGGYDRTAEFGEAIAEAPTAVLNGSPSGVTYNAATETLAIAGNTAPTLKAADVLYANNIKFIEQA